MFFGRFCCKFAALKIQNPKNNTAMRKIESMKHPVGRRAASMLKVLGYSHLVCKREYGSGDTVVKSSPKSNFVHCAAPNRRDAIGWLKDGLGARIKLRSRNRGITWYCEAAFPDGDWRETPGFPTAAEALDQWIVTVCLKALTDMDVEGDLPAVLSVGQMGCKDEDINLHSAAAWMYDKADVVVETLKVDGRWAVNLFYPAGSVPVPFPFDTMHEAKIAGVLIAAHRYMNNDNTGYCDEKD